MQLIIDVKDNAVAEKIIQILNVFKGDGVDIRKIDTKSDEQNNTQEYDIDYEKSFQYKLDRADFIEMKEKL